MHTFGADPELFLHNGKHYVSSIGKIGGSKTDPLRVVKGFFLQEDNVAVEYNIPPTSCPDKFVWANKLMLEEIADRVTKYSCTPKIVSSAEFLDSELDCEAARVFGCDPDYNAWDLEVNPSPNSENKNLRSAGGHIHFGIEGLSVKEKIQYVRVCDLFLGIPLAHLDPESKRRELYGRAGACRVKPYGFEYRTPSNVWLRDEDLMHQVATICVNIPNLYEKYKDWISDQEEKIAGAINRLDKALAYSFYEQLSQKWDSKYLEALVPDDIGGDLGIILEIK